MAYLPVLAGARKGWRHFVAVCGGAARRSLAHGLCRLGIATEEPLHKRSYAQEPRSHNVKSRQNKESIAINKHTYIIHTHTPHYDLYMYASIALTRQGRRRCCRSSSAALAQAHRCVLLRKHGGNNCDIQAL